MKIDGTPGKLNRNQQLLIAQTAWQGSDERQYVWVVQCMAPRGETPCGHMYGVDAADFFQRKCPACQGGPPGVVVKPDESPPGSSS
jgi:hypothetical protein